MLVYTVFKMMKYEESIREERIITKYVEDESKALFVKATSEQLKDFVSKSEHRFKTGKVYFEKKVRQDKNIIEYENFFLKGVNLGVAVPGKFPAEFSLTFEKYLEWIQMIGDMNANVIRVYTILPPDFYKALSFYNLYNADNPVYLMQGVWAKVPKSEDYFDAEYTRGFQKEIIDVINVIHGKAVLKEKPGKAHGVYTTDISKYVVGLLLGREWEPGSVYATIGNHKTDHFAGNFVTVQDGNAMEVWLAEQLDLAATYETQTYLWQHPLSFVNWLPLDPMYHYTEFIESKKVKEYDNDLASIDFRKFNATNLLKTGIYAAYHAYPYYPDFIYLQDDYANALNYKGEKDNYFGYLNDLKHHTEGMPLVIAEYGLPSSRGISHFTPSGFNQGGHSEKKQAELSLELTKDIVKTNCAGAIFFEWADEWFKHNWLVMDFELPFKNRKIWHNMENPEQNFGILALESPRETAKNYTDTLKTSIPFRTSANPSYFNISAVLPQFDFKQNNLYIAIDTYDKEKGDHRLPFTEDEYENGFEFLVSFISKNEAKIQVDEPYSVFTDIYNDYRPIYASKKNNNGKFIDEFMLVNRGRKTLLDEKTDSIINDRSILLNGDFTKPETSNADWNWDKSSHRFNLRLDWHLLNVSDPSHKYVLDDKEGTRTIEYTKTDGFNLYFFITDKENNVIGQYPIEKPYFSTWEDWDIPDYTQRIKPLFDTLKNYFSNLKVDEETNDTTQEEKFEIADFFHNKKASVSITFDNSGYSQYQYALPELNKYKLNADFSISPKFLNSVSGYSDYDEGVTINRMGLDEYGEIRSYGNEIALQIEQDENIDKSMIGKPFQTIHYHYKKATTFFDKKATFIREESKNKISNFTYNGIPYIEVKTNITQIVLDSILKSGLDKWTVFNYHHIYKDTSEVWKYDKQVINDYFIELTRFKKQIRLIRNSGYWIDTESRIFKYLKEREASTIKTKKFGELTFLTLESNLNTDKFNQPLTIKFTTNAELIKISGSETDGIYKNYNGSFLFDVAPQAEIKIEVLKQ